MNTTIFISGLTAFSLVAVGCGGFVDLRTHQDREGGVGGMTQGAGGVSRQDPQTGAGGASEGSPSGRGGLGEGGASSGAGGDSSGEGGAMLVDAGSAKGGAGGAELAGMGGAVLSGGGAGMGGAERTDPWVDAGFPDAGQLEDFCVGGTAKVGWQGQTYSPPVTTKSTDLFLDCCSAYAAHLHTSQSLGLDLDVVLRFYGASVRNGLYDLGTSGSSIMGTLRATRQGDAGAAAGSALNGLARISGADAGQTKPWQMAICASVNEPGGPYDGMRIYVPEVNVASYASDRRLAMWRLRDSSLTGSDVAGADINTLELAAQPFLSLSELDFVDLATDCVIPGDQAPCMRFGLNAGYPPSSTLLNDLRKGGASFVGLEGIPFVVEADGERIYLGAFMTSISSIGSPGPSVLVEEIDDYGFPLYGSRGSAGDTKSDPRRDPRILKVLNETSKAVP